MGNSKTITREYAERLIASTNGAFFSVSFVKADGTHRDMVCRLGVRKGVKGVGMSYDPKDRDLRPVFDVAKRDYRMIPLNTLYSLTVDGKTFAVIQ